MLFHGMNSFIVGTTRHADTLCEHNAAFSALEQVVYIDPVSFKGLIYVSKRICENWIITLRLNCDLFNDAVT
jgi:hypothetical protein